MGVLLMIVGGLVLATLCVRGALAFWQDLNKKEDKEGEK